MRRDRRSKLCSFASRARRAWGLTSSSLFAKRECWRLGVGNCCASFIVPPIVSGATPTLEAVFLRFSRTSRWGLTSSSLFAKRDVGGLASAIVALRSSFLRSSATRLRRSKLGCLRVSVPPPTPRPAKVVIRCADVDVARMLCSCRRASSCAARNEIGDRRKAPARPGPSDC